MQTKPIESTKSVVNISPWMVFFAALCTTVTIVAVTLFGLTQMAAGLQIAVFAATLILIVLGASFTIHRIQQL